MVYVPAGLLRHFPDRPWKEWTAEVRAVRASCRLAAAKWQRAEEECEETALWAAAFAKCDRGRGLWVLEPLARRRAWLDELQGKYLN